MDHYYQTYTKDKLLKISAIFEADFINLTIFEDGNAWNSIIPKEEIRRQSGDADFDEYYIKLKSYLRSCPEDVEFSFILGKLTISLLLQNEMKILFFTSTLKQVDFVENIFCMVGKLFNDKTQCLEKLSNLEKQNKILQNDNEILNKKLDVFIERRKAEEQKLYGSFMVLLNKKKHHIQQLKDVLVAFKKGKQNLDYKERSNGASTKNVQTKKAIKIEKVSEPDDASSSSDSYNTDNEERDNKDEANNILRKTASPVPSTSKSSISFLEENSPRKSFTYAKRIRTDDNLRLRVHLPGTTSKETNNAEHEIDTDSKKDDSGIASPTVNFNTQDLLDNL